MDLNKIQSVAIPAPPLIAIYGPPGIGKTAFGVGADSASDYNIGKDDHILMNVDFRGGFRIKCKRFFENPMSGMADIQKCFKALAETDHDLKWLCIDDLSTLEELFVKEVCKENNVDEIAKIEYGRGYELAKVKWLKFFDMISQLQELKKIGIILIGHTKVESQKDPMSESYSHHDLQLDKRSREIVKKAVDTIGYAHTFVRTKEEDSGFGAKSIVSVGQASRILSFDPDNMRFESKNRFNKIPSDIPLDWSVFEDELNKAFLPEEKTDEKLKKKDKKVVDTKEFTSTPIKNTW